MSNDAAQLAEVDVLEKEILEIKQEILRVGLLKEESVRANALANFIPHPKQLWFFQNADKKQRAGFCGNRFGKSTLGVVEDCSWALGERPFFEEDNPLRRLGIPEHGVKILVLSEDWDKVHELFTNDKSNERIGKFFEFLPKDKIVGTTRMQKGIINSITTRTTIDGRVRDSTIVFDTVRSFINNPRSFESSDWDAIHVDEPIPEDLWNATSRGLIDRGGFGWWLLTPLGFPWMYDKMLEWCAEKPERNWMFEADMDDNPTLNEEAKETYLMQLPEDERDCRKHGKPLAYGRRVYGHFEDKRHIWSKDEPPSGWKAFNQPSLDYLCGYAMDTHAQTPHAVLFIALSPFGDIFVYDEIWEKCMIDELAKKVVEKRNRVRCGWELCDPIAWIENPDTGSRWCDTLMNNGLNVIRATKDKTDGVIATQQIFSPNYPRRVYVMKHCVRFIKEIKAYFFDRENKPIDKDDHMMENLYRSVMHGLQWYPGMDKSKPIFAKDEFTKISTGGLPYEETINI